VIRVVIADDEPLARDGLAALIGSAQDIEVVDVAADGAQALAVVAMHRPDVVMMDIRMPILDGIATTAHLVEQYGPAAPRIIMLTTFDSDENVFDAFRAGASGFMLKDAGAAEFIRAVRIVAGGDALLAPSITRRMIAEFAHRRPPSPGTGRLDGLTTREREVLISIARGLSNREIAASLVVAEETVKTHVSRILAKLGLRDRTQAIVIAYESGLVVAGGSAASAGIRSS
jgi:DNA-binding NarL/FixJ family response regulator